MKSGWQKIGESIIDSVLVVGWLSLIWLVAVGSCKVFESSRPSRWKVHEPELHDAGDSFDFDSVKPKMGIGD